jgi:hypothetical protein
MGMPKRDHEIVLLTAEILVCSCGDQLSLLKADIEKTKMRRYDILLDAHALHKRRKNGHQKDR